MNGEIVELTAVLRRTGVVWLAWEIEELGGAWDSSQAAEHVRSRLSNVIDQLDASLHNIRQLDGGSTESLALEHPHEPEEPDTEVAGDALHPEEYTDTKTQPDVLTAADLREALDQLIRLVNALEEWERADG